MRPEGGPWACITQWRMRMTSQDTSTLAAAAGPATPVAGGHSVSTAPAAPVPAAEVAVPTPLAAAEPAEPPPPQATTWITKEAGNRRLPFERARLERSIQAIHAEFPQLDIDDYTRSVCGFVERKDSV